MTVGSDVAFDASNPDVTVTYLRDDGAVQRQSTPSLDNDRYVIMEEIGAGGMGVVFRAYDKRLRREVALKRLRYSACAGELETTAGLRLLREAQAMAQLAHPNVVPVYDVETDGARVFIAMQYVEGQSLRRWLLRERPPWRDVLRVFVEAGRGLAAAHACGVIHRDFKPGNVLLGDDGRARVLDFGLAHSDGSGAGTAADVAFPDVPTPSGASWDSHLTQTGELMGTPAYMPPEQHGGKTIDARGDQFSFCATLYRGVYGRPAYGARLGDRTLLEQKQAGPPPPVGSEVPRWLYRAIARGLAPAPEDRWASMEQLLAALTHDRTRRWRAASLGGSIAFGVGALLVGEFRGSTQTPCADLASPVEEAWGEPRKAAVRQALEQTQVAFASDTWTRVETTLDAYAAAWVDQRVSACEATRIGAAQTEAMLDRQVLCLQARSVRLRALVDVLANADADVVVRAAEATERLPPIAQCADLDRLMAEVEPPADAITARRVAELNETVAHYFALEGAGRYADAMQTARQLELDATVVGYRPLVAQALQLRANAEANSGSYELAVTKYKAAYFAAMGDERKMGEVAASLVFMLALRLDQPKQALWWSEHGEAALAKAGDAPAERASLIRATGIAHETMGEYVQAEAYYRQSLQIREELFGPNNARTAAALNSVGAALINQERYDDARPFVVRARAVFETTRGADHPVIASTLNNLAIIYSGKQDLEGALKIQRRMLQLRIASAGPEHPRVALAHVAIAGTLTGLGELGGALAHVERALDLYRVSAPGGKPPEAAARIARALILATLQRYDEAEQDIVRARELLVRALGPDHPRLVVTFQALGAIESYRGNRAGACEHFGAALELVNRTALRDSSVKARAQAGVDEHCSAPNPAN